MDTLPTGSGVEGFIAGMERCGAGPRLEACVVTFDVVPVGGSRAGTTLRSGAGVDELAPWPMLPPHWVHLPAEVVLAPTNAAISELDGWTKHSRDIPAWGNAAEPAQAWLAHVRSVLDAAT